MSETGEPSQRAERPGNYDDDPVTRRDIKIILDRQGRGLGPDEDARRTSTEQDRIDAGREPGVRDEIIAAAKLKLTRGPSARASAEIAGAQARMEELRQAEIARVRAEISAANDSYRASFPLRIDTPDKAAKWINEHGGRVDGDKPDEYALSERT